MTAIYQVRLQQFSALSDSVFNNVFYYRPSDGVGPVDGAASMPAGFNNPQFLDQTGTTVSLLTLINAVQATAVSNALLEGISLFNPLDFGTQVQTGGGSVGSDVDSFATAVRFRTARVRRDIRRGQKRFAGVPEIAASEGLLQDFGGTYFNALDTLRNVLGLPLVVPAPSGDFTAIPVVVKRVRFTTPSGGVGYRLPSTEAELGTNFFDATAWETDFTVSTQTSRRRSPRFTP